MRQCKYIVIDGIMAVIFSDLMTHRDVAHSLMRRDQEVTGAGFVCIDSSDNQINVGVYGRSESLDIDNNGADDVRAIKRALGMWNEGL